MKQIYTTGKRKTAVARAVIIEGSGKVLINKQNYLAILSGKPPEPLEPIKK
ncbi:30S ribosomal protein S9 [Patescibacteria group bacterium]|nr:30S ribosomal protein S9 [Patescibacteria group bacterium]